MALNFPGPYEIRQFYTVDGLEHQFRLSCALNSPVNLGEDYANITGLTPNGNNVDLVTVVETLLGILAGEFSASDTTFGRNELWVYNPLTFDASFVSSYNPVTQPTGGTGYVSAQQSTFTWRTTEGGIMKLVLMETKRQFGSPAAFPTSTGALNDIFSHVVGDNNSIYRARDTSRPFTGLSWASSQNDAIFRKRFRQ